MKKRSRILLLILAFCLTISGITVSAADDRLGTVVDGSLLTDNSEATFLVSPKARGVFLASGSGGVFIQSSRYLRMQGTTTCYNSVDELNVSLHLQRLEGNSWVHVYTLPTKTAYNTYTVTKSGYKTVTGGYYYRVYGVHVAMDGSSTESLTSYTDGLWVD